MPDPPKYIARLHPGGRVYRSLSAYLASVSQYGPTLGTKSLPSKLLAAKAATKQTEEKSKEKAKEEKEKKPLSIETWVDVDYTFIAVESSIEVDYAPEFLEVESSSSVEESVRLDWAAETDETLTLDWTATATPRKPSSTDSSGKGRTE